MATTTQKAPKKGTAVTDPKAAQKVLYDAMKQPGVRDLMEAYGEAKRYQDAAAVYQSVLTARTVEWASDSATPECV
jgi:hypothetical protein